MRMHGNRAENFHLLTKRGSKTLHYITKLAWCTSGSIYKSKTILVQILTHDSFVSMCPHVVQSHQIWMLLILLIVQANVEMMRILTGVSVIVRIQTIQGPCLVPRSLGS